MSQILFSAPANINDFEQNSNLALNGIKLWKVY